MEQEFMKKAAEFIYMPTRLSMDQQSIATVLNTTIVAMAAWVTRIRTTGN